MARNRHHELPTSRGGSDHPENLLDINVDEHDRFHSVFGNKVFNEQLLYLLRINQNILKPEFREKIIDLILTDPLDVYKRHAFRKEEAIAHIRANLRRLLDELLD